MMKKKTLAMLLSAALCVSLFAGCSGGSANSPAPESSTPAAEGSTPVSEAPTQLSGIVNTNGSTSMEKVIGYLTEGFKEVQPGVKQITVAKDGIAIIVNPENPVADLSVEQIAQLATGEIANWSEVGGNDGAVVFIGREAGSGTRDGFESITDTKDACKYQNELTSTGEVIANVASNPNAIGYASLSAVDETVKAITVGGVEATEETVLDGSYAIQRNFNFIINESSPLSEAAQTFVDWATSAEASDLIAGAGAVPLA